MTHQILKDFWIDKINNLITTFSLDPSTLAEGADWADKINALDKWREIDFLGKNICHDVYNKLGKAVPTPICAPGENYNEFLVNSFDDYELQFIDLANVCKTKIGVDPTDDTNILVDGHTIPKWKHTINSKFPINASHRQFTLNDLGSLDIVDFLYRTDLYNAITDTTNGLGNLIERNLTGNDREDGYGYKWHFKVNKTVLQNYKKRKYLGQLSRSELFVKSANTCQRGSIGFWHWHFSKFKSAPHSEHSPRQSSRHSTRFGRFNSNCSITRSSKLIWSFS